MQENEALNGEKRRKGVRHDVNYKRNRIRDARVKGKAHKNYRNQNVTAKTYKTVSCRCPLKCCRKIEQDTTQRIFDNFYNMKTKGEQDIYLQGMIEAVTVKKEANVKRKEKIVLDPFIISSRLMVKR